MICLKKRKFSIYLAPFLRLNLCCIWFKGEVESKLIQFWFNVESVLKYQRWINVYMSTLNQRLYVSFLFKFQIQIYFQHYFNIYCQRWITIETYSCQLGRLLLSSPWRNLGLIVCVICNSKVNIPLYSYFVKRFFTHWNVHLLFCAHIMNKFAFFLSIEQIQ